MQTKGVEALEQALSKAVRDVPSRHGVVRGIARDYVFKLFEDYAKFHRMTAVDVMHLRSCKRPQVQFEHRRHKLPSEGAEFLSTLQKLARKTVAALPDNLRAICEHRCEPTEHRAYCVSCPRDELRYSVLVTFDFAGETFSRRFAV